MRTTRLVSFLAFSTTLFGAVAALACSYGQPGEFQVNEAVLDADTRVPEVAEWTLVFRGPSLGSDSVDGGCQQTSCDDIASLNVIARLNGPAEWPLEGSFSTESAAAAGITPALVVETRGNAPCADGLAALVENPIPAGGDLFGTQFSQSMHWVCQPRDLAPWDFQVRAAFVDIDGDVGPFSEWVDISGDVGGCEREESGCAASPGTAAAGSWAFLVAAAAGWARRRRHTRHDVWPNPTAHSHATPAEWARRRFTAR